MPVKKLEDIIGPNGGSKIAKGMAVLRGVPVLGVDFQLVRFARVFHDCRESLARRLNASEGISGHGDTVRLNETLFSQPGKGAN
jgi:hypothetical protein